MTGKLQTIEEVCKAEWQRGRVGWSISTGQVKPAFHLARHNTARYDLSCCVASRNVTCRACSNMENKEVMVIACTILVFRALGIHVQNVKTAKTQCGFETIWQQSSTHFDTFNMPFVGMTRLVVHNKSSSAKMH